MTKKPTPAGPVASRVAGPAPGRVELNEAALRHLSRFATTEAGLVRVLDRRIARWARAATAEGTCPDGSVEAARLAARAVAQACVSLGMVNDAVFATARAARLTRSGRSRRAVAAHLAGKGISAELVQAALPSADDEVSSALAFSRKRRIGPFRQDPIRETDGQDVGRQELAALARAGFSRDVAEQALRTPYEDAIAAILALRRGRDH